SIQEAQRISQESPYPSWPRALVETVQRKGYVLAVDEASEYINEFKAKPSLPVAERPAQPPRFRSPGRQSVTPRVQGDMDLRHTVVLNGQFGGRNVRAWNELVETAIVAAIEMGKSVADLRRFVPVVEGRRTGRGFRPIKGHKVSYQNMDAQNCWRKSCSLAKVLGKNIHMTVQWREKEGAAYPGETRELTFP
ncbi:MAG TPA: hypothetical protein VLH60_04795, partial [Sedimentisphaerales bacterium]|nr:hypothetical protein [Sedimentisphaerales bacterium]